MALVERQRGSKAKGCGPASAAVDSVSLQNLTTRRWINRSASLSDRTPYLDRLVTKLWRFEVDRTKGPFASSIEQQIGILLLRLLEALQQMLPSVGYLLDQTFLLDHLDYLVQQKQLGGVSKPGVEYPEWLLWAKGIPVEESADQHLLAKRHDVGRAVQVEVLVGPEFSRRSTASLNLCGGEKETDTQNLDH